jgi:hypothetical protein
MVKDLKFPQSNVEPSHQKWLQNQRLLGQEVSERGVPEV